MADELGCRSDAQNTGGALAVDCALGGFLRLIERGLSDHQGEELRAVGRVDLVGRNAEGERVETLR